MSHFSLIKRKSSAYFPRKKLHSTFNRKSSAYFTLKGYSIRDTHDITTPILRKAPQPRDPLKLILQ